MLGGGGGGSVTIGPFIWLYLWDTVLWVYGLQMWSAVGGCWLSLNHVLLQVSATIVAVQAVRQSVCLDALNKAVL